MKAYSGVDFQRNINKRIINGYCLPVVVNSVHICISLSVFLIWKTSHYSKKNIFTVMCECWCGCVHVCSRSENYEESYLKNQENGSEILKPLEEIQCFRLVINYF
jgi:hypothetical protein